MTCPNGHKLDDDYAGLFCIYCSEPVASIVNADGQLALKDNESNRYKKYAAIIYKDKQREVSNVEVISSITEIKFKDGEEVKNDLKTHQVIMAFQDPEEKLVI